MWGWSIEAMREAMASKPTATMSQEDIDKAKRKSAAEKQVDELGEADCIHCGEEIRKNESLPGSGWIWESEFMLGFCHMSGDRKHRPKIVWE